MKETIIELKNLGFTTTESEVYIALLKNSGLTGYQIAKNLEVSRAAVYSALDSLYKKGVINLLQGETNRYKAEDPEQLFTRMKDEYTKKTEKVKEELLKINNDKKDNSFYNLENYKKIIDKAKEILLSAVKEVYINTNYSLDIFEKELIILKERGIRVIVFSFTAINPKNFPVEMYYHYSKTAGTCNDERLMIVVDFNKAIMANTENKKDYYGTFTENKLFVSVLAEHIHHDIYLLKLKNKENKEILDNEIKLNTLLENREERYDFLYKLNSKL